MKLLTKSNFTIKPLKAGAYLVTYTSKQMLTCKKAVITDMSKIENVLNSTNPSYMALHELRSAVVNAK